MSDKLPTLKEIAKRLNVSTSTVSRALSDHPRIGVNTKIMVQQLAKELHYEPNSTALFFKQKKSFIIGVVLPFIKEEFFSEAISGIESATIVQDYTILFGQSYDSMEREKKVVDAMKKQRVDGLIISLSKQTDTYEHLHALDNYDIPIVYFDRVPSFANAHKIYCNLYLGTIKMVNWLFGQGYRRIAFINGPDQLLASKERLRGYIESYYRRKVKVDMQMVESSDLSKESTFEAMKKLLTLKHPPNAIITFNEYVHFDAVQYAKQQNLEINKDIVFVSYANLPMTVHSAFPPIASMEQQPFQQGEKAMEIMMKLLHAKEQGKAFNEIYYQEEIHVDLMINEAYSEIVITHPIK